MNRSFKLLLVFMAAVVISAALVVHADAPKTQTVEFPSGKETISGFLAVPDKPGQYPALVVIQEWWGLNDWVKEQTEKLAAQGYVALAVDLYRGKTATDAAEAHELMRGLPQDRAIRDMQAAYTYLARAKTSSPTRSARSAGAWAAGFPCNWRFMSRISLLAW